MQRSKINFVLAESETFIRSFGFHLPRFAYWTPEDFRAAPEGTRIVEAGMGWDITDYGQGNFDDLGLVLFTLRNGSLADQKAGRGLVYAEKLLISRQNQISPMHTHKLKTEDIINRGGGRLVVELVGSDPAGGISDDTGGRVMVDGCPVDYAPGTRIGLDPGQSVTLRPGDWHAFWGENGDVLIGEVSSVNDDVNDNIFRDRIGRFSSVEEDVAPLRLLVSDYEKWLGSD